MCWAEGWTEQAEAPPGLFRTVLHIWSKSSLEFSLDVAWTVQTPVFGDEGQGGRDLIRHLFSRVLALRIKAKFEKIETENERQK